MATSLFVITFTCYEVTEKDLDPKLIIFSILRTGKRQVPVDLLDTKKSVFSSIQSLKKLKRLNTNHNKIEIHVSEKRKRNPDDEP